MFSHRAWKVSARRVQRLPRPGQAGARVPARRSLGTAVAAAVLAFATVAVNAGSVDVASAANMWTSPTSIIHLAPIYDISCTSASFCAAYTSNASDSSVLTYNGTTWSTPTSVGTMLTSISCVSGPFCLAVGNGETFTFVGSSWTLTATNDGVKYVSCVSTSFCEGIDNSNAYTYTGSWSGPTPIDGDTFDGNDATLVGLSCQSSLFCVAIDQNSTNQSGDALIYTGSSWTAPQSIDGSLLESVSCAAPSFCVATDSSGNELVYNGSSWTGPFNIADGSVSIPSVSCPSTSFCAAIDLGGSAMTYNGTSWSAPDDIDSSRELVTVSCSEPLFCAATDIDGFGVYYEPVPPSTITKPASTSIVLGASNTDGATVNGNGPGSPTGTVTFYECGPSASPAPCTSTANQVGSPVTVSPGQNGTSTAVSATFRPDATGYWCFAGYYSGDGSDSPTSDTSSDECFDVTPADKITKFTPKSGRKRPSRPSGNYRRDSTSWPWWCRGVRPRGPRLPRCSAGPTQTE